MNAFLDHVYAVNLRSRQARRPFRRGVLARRHRDVLTGCWLRPVAVAVGAVRVAVQHGQVLQGGLIDPVVTVGLDPVRVGLPVLAEQDQRGHVGGLGRKDQVQQDERVRIPPVGQPLTPVPVIMVATVGCGPRPIPEPSPQRGDFRRERETGRPACRPC